MGWKFDYDGDQIQIEEMPQGCILYQTSDGGHRTSEIIISSRDDALAVIESLQRMIEHLDKENE